MCVILLGKNKDILKSNLDLAWASNPHGAGILYHDRRGSVVCVKGLMTLEALTDALGDVGRDTQMAVHLRYATHGAVSAANTHPFAVGKSGYLMHNGMLSAFGRSGTRGVSDSADLARTLGTIPSDSDRLKVLRSLQGMFLLATRGGFTPIGSRSWVRVGRVLASNDNFLPRTPVVAGWQGNRWAHSWE